jgi:hypothetical protein
MSIPPIPSLASGPSSDGNRCAKNRKEDPCKTLTAVN